jgi:hypothetical protein
MPKGRIEYYGPHFDGQRTRATRGDVDILRGNFVSLTMLAGSTDFEALLEIGRSSREPFRVKFLSEKLRAKAYIRGRVFFGRLPDVIAKVLLEYPLLRWWIEEEGLVVDEARPELGPLSDFDRIAGALIIEHSRRGKVSAQALKSIAIRLDETEFGLRENLQPAQWKPISEYNQKYSRAPIKTFAAAVAYPREARFQNKSLK